MTRLSNDMGSRVGGVFQPTAVRERERERERKR